MITFQCQEQNIVTNIMGKQSSIYKCTFRFKAVAILQWTARTIQPERKRKW